MNLDYFYKSRWWMRLLYPSLTWKIKTTNKEIFLTFDDGPEPVITPWVLDTLSKYNAKATFFCIGNNVTKHPEVYQRIIDEGHLTGNHTYNHENGWKTDYKEYIESVKKCEHTFGSIFFRPPYGKIKFRQIRKIKKRFQIIMWTVLSGDFDKTISKESSLDTTLKYSEKGNIIVFHDSLKAEEKLKYILPKVLEELTNKGYIFNSLPRASV